MARDFHETFKRLTALLLSETEALRNGGTTDLAANADSKARILLELAQWQCKGEVLALNRDEAANLLVLLNDNAQVLERHMAAANRIASNIAQHLRDADSDGTYGAGYGQSKRGFRA